MPESGRLSARLRPRYVLGAIVLLSIVLRVAFFAEMNATPLINLDRWSQSDMHYYNDWARQIAAGDWLSANVGPPMHLWQRDIADQYLTEHPLERADLEQQTRTAGSDVDLDAVLWRTWMHTPRFYQDPVYQYLVGVTYKILGSDVRYVFGWQMALGVFTNVLIWLLARRYFGDLVAAIAGGLAVLCAPLMYYETILLRESTVVFASLAIIWLIDYAIRRGSWWLFAALGVAVGAAGLLKSTMLLFGAVAAAAIAIAFRTRTRQLLASAGAMAGGLALAFTPFAVRNVTVRAPMIGWPSLGSFTFVSSNEESYSPDDGFSVNVPLMSKFLGETDAGWGAALDTSFRGRSIDSIASMVWRKWDRSWHWYEIPNNDNIYYAARSVPLLRWLPVTFGILAPLAIVGLVIGLRGWRETWLLYQLVLMSIAPLVIFYVLGRFRVPLIAACVPFSALTAGRIVEWLQQRRYTRTVAAVAAVALVALWTARPLAADQTLIRTDDWLAPFMIRDQAVLERAVAQKDWAGGAGAYERFFKDEPADAEIAASGDPNLPSRLAELHVICARLWRQAGQDIRADAHMARADHLRLIKVSR